MNAQWPVIVGQLFCTPRVRGGLARIVDAQPAPLMGSLRGKIGLTPSRMTSINV